MSEKLLFTCTHARDDPERAILPFVAANTAAVAGLEAVVLLTIEGVWLGTAGGTEEIAVLPWDIVDYAPAIEAAVQADRNEARLARHEACPAPYSSPPNSSDLA